MFDVARGSGETIFSFSSLCRGLYKETNYGSDVIRTYLLSIRGNDEVGFESAGIISPLLDVPICLHL